MHQKDIYYSGQGSLTVSINYPSFEPSVMNGERRTRGGDGSDKDGSNNRG